MYLLLHSGGGVYLSTSQVEWNVEILIGQMKYVYKLVLSMTAILEGSIYLEMF